ncbi:MAG: glycoside hydrolase family 9 protein, partial [Cytophagales bacterium]|nr:glycoside hydrolase family 9 protein [Cytophagales bacterium]
MSSYYSRTKGGIVFSAIFAGILFFGNFSQAQTYTATDYKKAVWMTTRFYGAQRSGLNNWTLYNHQPGSTPAAYKGTAFKDDNDAGYDMSGGWHDCGDHVKFGITQFYSAYMLLKSYHEFQRGYDDYYSFNYNGYNTSGLYAWEDNTHDPNGIPDILDEMKHECDFLIKCA